MDSVTDQLCFLELTPVQKALEAIHRSIDVQMLKLGNADGQRLLQKLYLLLDEMTPHT